MLQYDAQLRIIMGVNKEVFDMAAVKTANVNARIDRNVKAQAEAILSKIGLPRSVAIDAFYRQIIFHGGIPFALTVPESKLPAYDEMSVAEMNTLIELGGYETSAVESIGKVMTYDCDGPASINNNFTKQGSIGFPAAVMIACTWNKDIAHRFGASIGRMANDMDVSGWYAPATNTHRSAFAGRNFEYYSEDGVLAGWMCANAVQGAREWGVYSYVKHFATNDQETNRTGLLCTWLNEQSLREIYLKSFEIAFKNGNPGATMVAFNNIGIVPAEACPELLNTVLRGEWGFRGFAETDYFGGYGYQDADRMIRNGCDLMLATYSTPESTVTDQTSATSVNAMRTASKNILYTVVNSRAYDKAVNTGLPTWVKILYGVDVLLIGFIGFLEYRAIKAYKEKKKETEPAVEQQTQE